MSKLFSPVFLAMPFVAAVLFLFSLSANLSFAAGSVTVCPIGCDFTAVQPAIDAAPPQTIIMVSANTFTETLIITKSLTIQGTAMLSTTIDGNSSGPVVQIMAGTVITLVDMTLAHGSGLDIAGAQIGGGIVNYGRLTLLRVNINQNQAIGAGSNNVSEDGRPAFGGGVYNGCLGQQCGALLVVDTIIDGNQARGGDGADGADLGDGSDGGSAAGGAIYNESCGSSFCPSVTLSQTLLSGNIAIGGNGGYVNASGGIGQGGGVFNAGMAQVYEAAFIDNDAFGGAQTFAPYYFPRSDGGGVSNAGFLKVARSMFSRNRADFGGGINNHTSGSVHIKNTTISGNVAYGGGGGVHNLGVMAIEFTTIAGNEAGVPDSVRNTGWGGGLANSGAVTLAGVILADNVVYNFDQIVFEDCNGTLTSQGFNLVESVQPYCALTGSSGRDILGQPAYLAPLADNGGPTPTRGLLWVSPAIDAVPAYACSGTPLDQRGRPRPDDGDGDGTAVCDMGAFEGVISPTAVLYLPILLQE